MSTINIKDAFGEYCLDETDGKKFYFKLRNAMNSRGVTEFDFKGVRVVTSVFLEEAFFHITKAHPPYKIFSRIKFKNVEEHIKETIIFTIEHLRKYHKSTEYKRNINEYFNVKGSKEEKEVKKVANKKKGSRRKTKTQRTESVTIHCSDNMDAKPS